MANVQFSWKDEFRGLGQKLGKAILLPISILPVAGLCLGIPAALSSNAVKVAYPILTNESLQTILTVINSVGSGVFNALPIIFAVGIAAGLAKAEKGAAALSALIGYFVLLTSIGAMLSITNTIPPAGADIRLYGQAIQYGIKTLNMNVFGGIVAGIVTGFVHNRYYRTKLPDFLAFFGGARFVPIVNTLVFIIVGLIMFFIWPNIASFIALIGKFTQSLGITGAFLYGLMLRSFYIIGLHHVFYLPFWTTAAGGTLEVGNQIIEGWQQIFLAQLADSNTIKFFSNISLYNSGRYFHMLFGMPAICLAMYTTIPTLKMKKSTVGFLLSIALTSFITGVTEPISFALLFASPLLFFVEAIMFAVSFVIAAIFNITIGSTFSAGIIEFLLFGVFQGQAKTGYLWIIALGIPLFFLYYTVFKILILHFDAKTPGRDNIDDTSTELNLTTNYSGNPFVILEALGGLGNIDDLDNCATRLRVTVKKIDIVNIEQLKNTGAHHTIVRGKNLQIIYGPKVNLIKLDIDEYIESLSQG